MKVFRITFINGRSVAVMAERFKKNNIVRFFTEDNHVPIVTYPKSEVLMIEQITPERELDGLVDPPVG